MRTSHRLAQPQRAHDVGCDARRGGRRERHRAARADRVARIGEAQVVGPEVVAPLAQAVRLVDREERDLAPVDGGAEASVAEALGRDEHEPAEPSASAASTDSASPGGSEALSTCAAPCPAARQRIALIAHERDERRDHDRQPVEGQARELVAERLARARRHHDERVASVERGLDGLLLPGPERLVPEQAVQMRGRVHPGNLAAGVDAHRRACDVSTSCDADVRIASGLDRDCRGRGRVRRGGSRAGRSRRSGAGQREQRADGHRGRARR